MNGFFSIGDLIVLAIVVLVIFIYRRLDRNNKSLEIVKKYADNAKVELDKILEKKRSDLNDITIDLEVEEKKNRQILERFRDARDQLMENAAVLEGFQEQISYYNKYMDELRAVAGRIDENLLRLKDESEYVDTVGQRLNEIKSRESQLEKQLSGISKDFEKINRERLEIIESKLVEHFKGETEKFQNDLRNVGSEVENFKQSLDELNASREDYAQRQLAELRASLDASMNNFNSAISDAAAKGSALEGEVFEAIQKSVEERASKAEQNWLEGMSSLKEEVVKVVEETRTRLDNFDGEVDRWKDNQKAALSEAAEQSEYEINQWKEDQQRSLDILKTENENELREWENDKKLRMESVADRLGVLETELTTGSIKTKIDELSALNEEFVSNMEKQKNALSSRLEERLSEIEKEISGNLELWENARLEESKRLKEESSRNLSEMKASLDEGNLEAKNRINTFKKEIKESVNKLQHELHGVNLIRSEFGKEIEAMKKEVEKNAKEMNSIIDKYVLNESERVTRKADGVEVQIMRDIEDRRKAYEKIINDKMDKFQTVFGEIDKLEKSLKESIDAGIKKVKFDSDQFAEDILGQVETDLKGYKRAISKKYTRLEKLVTEMDSVEESLKTSLNTMSDRVAGDLDTFRTGMEEFRQTERARAEEDLVEVHQSIGGIKEELEEIKSSASANLNTVIESFETDFNLRLEEKNTGLRAELAKTTGEIQGELDNFSRLGDQLDSFKESLTGKVNLVEEEMDRVKENLLRDSEQKMSDFEKSVLEDFSVKTGTLSERLDQWSESLEKQLEEKNTGLREELTRTTGEIQSELNNFSMLGERIDSFKAGLTGQVNQVEEEMDRLKDQLLKDSEEKMSDFEKSVLENLSLRNRNLTERMDEWSETVEKQLEDLTNKKTGEIEKLEIQFRDDFSGQVKNIERRVDEQFAVVQELAKQYREKVMSHVQEASEEFESYRENVLGEMEGLKVNSAEAVSAIKNELSDAAQVKGDIDRLIAEYRNSVDSEVSRMESDLKSEILRISENMDNATQSMETNLLSNVEERQKSYEDLLKTRFSKIDRFMLDLDALETSLRKSMDQEVKDVQSEFDNFSKSMLAVRAEERKKLENESDNLRRTILEMEMQINEMKSDVYDNMGEKLRLFEDDFFADLKKRGENLESSIQKWRSEIDNRIKELGNNFIADREEVESRYSEELNNRLAELEGQLQSNMNRVSSDLEEFREGVSSRIQGEAEAAKNEMVDIINASRQDVTNWQNNVLDKLEEEKNDIDQNVSQFKDTVDENIRYLQDNFAEQRNTLIEQTQNERDNLRREISLTEEKLGSIEEELSLINQKQEEFKEHTQMFARTDQLKIQLENDIKRLEASVEAVGEEREQVQGIRNEFIEVTEMYKEASALISKFLSEKQKVDIMENKIDRMVDLSESVDRQYSRIGESGEQLQNYRMRLQQLEDIHADLQSRYAELEKKSPLLDSTSSTIDSSFEKITNINDELKNIMSQVAPLFERIQNMEDRNNNLFLENDRVELIMSRIEDLGAMLSDVDRRIEQSEKAREWLAGIEKRMEDLNKDIQDKVKILGDLTTGNTGKSDEAPDLEKREMVINLKKQKWENVQIARAVGLGVGEVELILEMEHGKAKGRPKK